MLNGSPFPARGTRTTARVSYLPKANDDGGRMDVDDMELSTDEKWKLRLYVAGDSPKSRRALSNLRNLCEQHLPGGYEIEVVDLLQDPTLAKAHEILAIPTLIRKLPEPI